MNKLLKQVIILACLVGILILPYFVFAESPLEKLKKVGPNSGFEPVDDADKGISKILGTVIQAFLSILGIIFIFLMLIAGYNWMTAAGKEEKVERAIHNIQRSIIGLIIIAGSYAIWKFIFEYFLKK